MKPLVTGGNQITLLECGPDFFPALIQAIHGAQREVHLETYIFADDDTGRAVAQALSQAARRGVAVRLLVDGFGADGFDHGLGAALVRDGVHLLVYRPKFGGLLSRPRWRRSRLRRMHRKLAVIDGHTAFAGGINIVDDWDDLNRRGQTPPRFDYAVQVTGPAVAQMHQAVRHLWQLVSWSRFGRRTLKPPPPLPGFRAHEATLAGTMQCAFVIRDNLRHRRDIEDAYLEAIANAREEILIANAYFLPGRRFMLSLLEAARRGVRVTLLLQGKVEYWLQHQATQSLYGRLLREGIVIHEYRRSFLHAKVAVIDNNWATVGSSNIDPFSLLLAREANVLVFDPDFAKELKVSLERAIKTGAEKIKSDSLSHRTFWQRLQGRLAYFLVRLAASLSHHDANHEY